MTAAAVHLIALALYIAASVFYGAHLSLKVPGHLRSARLFFVLGFLFHTAAIGTLCVQMQRSPFSSAFGTLSIAAWTVALLYLPTEFIWRLPALGALAVPLSSLLLFSALLRSHAAIATDPVLQRSSTNIHVFLILLSFALFSLAACCAVFYVWQYRLLKRHKPSSLFRRLPPLETVDSIALQLVAFALPLLTVGMALGAVAAAGGGLHGNWIVDPHTIASVVAWLVYGAYLLMRTVGGWRGTRPHYLLIAGLVVTIAIFFIPSTTHRFP